jgi:hypothetical protein
MVSSLQAIAELLKVFSFTLLGITFWVVVYALLQVLLQAVIRPRESRSVSGDTNATCEDRVRDASTIWNAFSSNPRASTGFTRHVKQ